MQATSIVSGMPVARVVPLGGMYRSGRQYAPLFTDVETNLRQVGAVGAEYASRFITSTLSTSSDVLDALDYAVTVRLGVKPAEPLKPKYPTHKLPRLQAP